jgi:hypothetical protein
LQASSQLWHLIFLPGIQRIGLLIFFICERLGNTTKIESKVWIL